MTQQPYIAGIDLGGTKILAAILTPEGEILGRAKRRTKAERGAEAIVERIAKTLKKAASVSGVDYEAIRCVGIGAPGAIDPVRGVISEAPNLKLADFPLKAVLEEKTGKPFYACNDVNAGTWGEFAAGAARGYSSVLGVFVGTGIGGGLIVGGELFEGAGLAAGEIGHVCVRYNGPVCGCGRRGCLEAMASKTALERMIRRALKKGCQSVIAGELTGKTQLRSGMIARAWEAGDPLVRRIVERSTAYLGTGLGGAANLLNPECIVLGGGVAESLGADYVRLIQKAMDQASFASVAASTRLVVSELGDDAVLTGAALLALKRLTNEG